MGEENHEVIKYGVQGSLTKKIKMKKVSCFFLKIAAVFFY